jgi:hypothetical protein
MSEPTDAPAVKESAGAKHVARPQWPVTSFTVENIPVITLEGTRLTEAQLKRAEEAAEAQGIGLDVEEVK